MKVQTCQLIFLVTISLFLPDSRWQNKSKTVGPIQTNTINKTSPCHFPSDDDHSSFNVTFSDKFKNIDDLTHIFYFIRHIRTQPPSVPVTIQRRQQLYMLLLVCGDISMNPGPVKNPCGFCSKPVAKTHRAIYCDGCFYWCHIKCAGITPDEYYLLGNDNNPWLCKNCDQFHFSDSFFSQIDASISSGSCDLNEDSLNIFEELCELKLKFPKRFLCAYLNINSLRYKFDSIKDLLNRNILDILFLSETKIDDSFLDALFSVDNYHLWRADRTDRGGGVAAYLRSDIAGDRQKDFEFKHIESISVEVNLQNSKLLICGAYKPPSMTDQIFENDCSMTLDKISTKYEHYILLGDLNFDMLCKQKSSPLMNLCDVFDLQNLIKKPTCYTQHHNPSLVDVILTNSDYVSKISGTCNFSSGLSDVHNVIACQLKFEIPENKSKWCNYRSFKHFDANVFNNDLQNKLNLSVLDDKENVNSAYQMFSNAFLETANKHAPLKKKKVLPKPLPYMNKNLKQEIYKKKCFLTNFKNVSQPEIGKIFENKGTWLLA